MLCNMPCIDSLDSNTCTHGMLQYFTVYTCTVGLAPAELSRFVHFFPPEELRPITDNIQEDTKWKRRHGGGENMNERVALYDNVT